MASYFYLGWRMLYETNRLYERNFMREQRSARRQSSNPVSDLSRDEFRRRYRLTKEAFVYLCAELRQSTVLKATQRISLELKVLAALSFYATGSYQRPIGMAENVSQQAISEFLSEVTNALNHTSIINKFIKFPATPVARAAVRERFFSKYGMPGVVGCVDGSHFKIFTPAREVEHLYYCRKHYHSLNVQIVCDSDCRILAVNSKYGGATHDSFIWENSQINRYMQSLHANGEIVWLLGDSGYPQRPWLMTPCSNPAQGSRESIYNAKHGTARVVIENTFGRLKNRWRCLSKDRVLHYSPQKSSQIITACCVLHNLALTYGVPEPLETETDASTEFLEQEQFHSEENAPHLTRGRALREQLIHRINII